MITLRLLIGKFSNTKINNTLLAAIVILFVSYTYGQRPKNIKNSEVKGIFLTHADFNQNKKICSSNNQNKDIKIKLKQFFISPEISCLELQKDTGFYKNSIFALHLSNGDNYRYINRNPCLIADTSFLFIYTYNTIKTEYKQSDPSRSTKKIPVTYYYFSSGQNKEVYFLIISNLCKSLQIESDIKVAINQKYKSDEMLYSMNQKTGHFIINKFLIELTQNKQ